MLELIQKVQPGGALAHSGCRFIRSCSFSCSPPQSHHSCSPLLLPPYQDLKIVSLSLRLNECVFVSNAALNSEACDLLVATSPAGEGAATSVRS